jgi:hypothetical protein
MDKICNNMINVLIYSYHSNIIKYELYQYNIVKCVGLQNRKKIKI